MSTSHDAACAAFREAIQQDLDAELSPAGQAALKVHLAGCPACAAYHEEMQALLSLVLEVGTTSRPELPARPRLLRRWLLPAAAAAGLAAVLFTLRPHPDGPPMSVSAAPAPAPTPVLAHLEPGSDGTDWLVCPMDSEQPDVHVIWLYPSVRTGDTP